MRHTLIVDSQDREYDTYPNPNAYRIDLPRNYRNVTRARLLTAEIPSTFYVFDASRDLTTVRFGVNGAFADVTIPDGNYSDVSLTSALAPALAAAFPGFTFRCTIDRVSMKFLVSCISNPESVLSIDTTDAQGDTNWGLAYYLGFEPGAVVSGTTLESPRVVCLNPQIYVVLDIAELNNIDEAGRSAFAKIPFDTNSFGYAFYAPGANMPFVEFSPPLSKLSRLSITLRFHDGTVLDFKGVEHSLTLEFETTVVPRDPMQTQVTPAVGPVIARAAPSVRVQRTSPPPPKKPRKRWAIWILAVLAAIFGGWYYIF